MSLSLEKEAVREHNAQVAEVGQSRLKLKVRSGRAKPGELSLEKEPDGTVREHSAKVAQVRQYRLNSRPGRAKPSDGGLSLEIERDETVREHAQVGHESMGPRHKTRPVQR